VHIDKSKLVPMSVIQDRVGELAAYKKKEIVVYCHPRRAEPAGRPVAPRTGVRRRQEHGGGYRPVVGRDRPQIAAVLNHLAASLCEPHVVREVTCRECTDLISRSEMTTMWFSRSARNGIRSPLPARRQIRRQERCAGVELKNGSAVATSHGGRVRTLREEHRPHLAERDDHIHSCERRLDSQSSDGASASKESVLAMTTIPESVTVKTPRPVVIGIESDFHPFGDAHSLVDDRAADAGATADIDAVEKNRVFDRGPNC